MFILIILLNFSILRNFFLETDLFYLVVGSLLLAMLVLQMLLIAVMVWATSEGSVFIGRIELGKKCDFSETQVSHYTVVYPLFPN